MGITIHYKLAQKPKFVKQTLDKAQEVAEKVKENQVGVPVEIFRESDSHLIIKIGNCESLAFNFAKFSCWKYLHETEGWNYEYAVLTDTGHELNEEYEWSAAFCKTQFADKLVEHKFVCDILKSVASMCEVAIVQDEGDYYHTGKIENVEDAIVENGKMISSFSGKLTKLGFEPQNMVVGKTNIKGRKKNAIIK